MQTAAESIAAIADLKVGDIVSIPEYKALAVEGEYNHVPVTRYDYPRRVLTLSDGSILTHWESGGFYYELRSGYVRIFKRFETLVVNA